MVSPELFHFWKCFDREPKQAITQPRESAAEEILFEWSRLKEVVYRLRGRATLHLLKIDFFIRVKSQSMTFESRLWVPALETVF